MAVFYTDHNVSLHVARLLTSWDHSAVTARDRGLERAGDDEQLLVAAQHASVFVTHNEKDFVLLHDAWRRWSRAWQVDPTHAGILVCPQTWSADRAAQEINDFLAGEYSLPNELYVWRSQSGWIRQS